jgi:hypothetical protein
MGVMTKKYGVSIYFYRKLAIFGKTVGEHRWILSEFFFPKLVKTHIWDNYV